MYDYLHHKQLLLTSQIHSMSRDEEKLVRKKYLHMCPLVTSKSPLMKFEFDCEFSFLSELFHQHFSLTFTTTQRL